MPKDEDEQRINISHSLQEDSVRQIKIARKLLILNLSVYLIISILELFVGTYASSVALLSDGKNNFTGIVSAILLIVGLSFSQIPSDKFHLEGHWQYENIAVFLAGLIMIFVGMNCIWDGCLHFFMFFEGHNVPIKGIAAFIAAISGFTMLCESLVNKFLGNRLNSGSLIAASKDYLTDSLASFGTMIAIIGTILFKIHWVDPITAILLGCFIIFNGGGIVSDSASKLSNGFDPKFRGKIVRDILLNKKVKRVSFVDSRYSGSNIIVEATIEIDGRTDTFRSYDLCKEIERSIQDVKGSLKM
ncbi:cation diffusion facilitator family transporter [Lentilactobacillus hilgardii]|uniref:cation diffusion facilitator family transporter n=1 Tax=Lentilactobacillus hilgardii TaxID=1588 RepID=UPI0039EBA9D0